MLKITPSHRGDLEITALNQMYLNDNSLRVELLGHGFSWLGMGTHESLLEAGLFVETVEKRQGYKIARLEEIAYNNGWLDKQIFRHVGEKMNKNSYEQYLLSLI